MTTTAWAHLPNATHIDVMFVHMRAHPDKWDAAREASRDAARSAAWSAAWNAGRDAAWTAARGAARGAAQSAARYAARDALVALIAYDDCAHYLKLTPGAVRVAASAGIPAAVLLLPAVIAMNSAS